jgi:hypothetical protein
MRFPLFIICAVLSSCASTYKPIRPTQLQYNQASDANGVSLGYRYDVLREKGNKKYAKREMKNGVRLVAVKIINNTDQALVLGGNSKLYTGRSEVLLIPSEDIHKSLKQGVAIYLLYLLMTPMQFTVTTANSNGSVDTDSTPIGLILGPGISIGNMAVSGSANKNLLDELNAFNLKGKTIQPGETAYGLIGIGSHLGVAPLSLEFN